MEVKSILWFRHGLRLHDNPSLLAAIEGGRQTVTFYPVFIFDGESAGEFDEKISVIDIKVTSYHITKDLNPRVNLLQRDLQTQESYDNIHTRD